MVMSASASQPGSGHLAFCIEEMLAELDEQLMESSPVRALRQLDAREARGESLEAVCPLALRAWIVAQIDALPLSQVRRKVLELKAFIAQPAAPTDTAVQPTVNDQAEPETGAAPQREVAACEIVSASANKTGRADSERAVTGSAKAAEAPAAPAQVVDFLSYRSAGLAAQAEHSTLPILSLKAEQGLPWWLETARPKARIRVPAGTYKALVIDGAGAGLLDKLAAGRDRAKPAGRDPDGCRATWRPRARQLDARGTPARRCDGALQSIARHRNPPRTPALNSPRCAVAVIAGTDVPRASSPSPRSRVLCPAPRRDSRCTSVRLASAFRSRSVGG